jgi:hypothetical protein
MSRPMRRRRLLLQLVALAAVVLAVLIVTCPAPSPDAGSRVPKPVAARVALVAFLFAGAGLIAAERALKRRRELEEAEAVLRQEYEADAREDTG